MRVATILVVLLIHVVLFILFAAPRIPVPRAGQEEAPSTAFFLPPNEAYTTAEGALQPPTAAQAAHPTSPKRPTAAGAKSPGATVRPEPEPPPSAMTVPAAPDWRREMQIAANNAIEAEESKRRQSSPLAPHDFSGVKPGSTDDTRRAFGWSHAATHRVEEIPTGGLIINVNDRCFIAWVVFPLAFCRVGKIPVRGDLFQAMKPPTALGEPEVP
jgi:hypothetical protein